MMWGGKLLSGIKSLYVDSLTCVRVKGGESERFRIDRVYHVPLAFQCSDERGKDGDGK